MHNSVYGSVASIAGSTNSEIRGPSETAKPKPLSIVIPEGTLFRPSTLSMIEPSQQARKLNYPMFLHLGEFSDNQH